MACVGGGIDVDWLVLAAACCVRGLVSGGGRGGVVWGWRCLWWGGRGWVLCWLGEGRKLCWLEEVLNSFLRQHNTEDGELSAYTEELISLLPKLYNRTQRRDMHRTPCTIQELDEVLYKLQPGKTPGVDGLPAELYSRLPLNLKRHLATRPWDIAIGKTDVPPDWANLVHPLYKKGRLGEPRQLETHRMRHHGGQTHMDAHPQTGGPSSVPACTAHHVGGHTG